eukprot:Gb_20565 [translate_table: standard]
MSEKPCLARSSPALSGEHAAVLVGSFYESPDSNTGEDFYGTSAGLKRGNKSGRFSTPTKSKSSAEDIHGMPLADFEFSDLTMIAPPPRHCASVRFVRCEVGQFVSLRDEDGKEVAHGIVHQVEGRWHGKKLDEQGLCVVEVTKLKVDRWTRLPHQSDMGGTTFEEAETLNGKMRVAWDTHKIFLMASNIQE